MKFLRTAKEGTGTAGHLILFLGIAVLLQFLAFRHPHEWDVTKAKRFSLSQLSKQVLSQAREPLDLWVFAEPSDRSTRDLVHQYEVASGMVRVNIVDPFSQPAKAREFGVNTRPPVVVVKYGQQQEPITEPSEEKLTNVINRLTSGTSRTVYFLEGQGEPDPNWGDPKGYSDFRDEIKAMNIRAETLTLNSAVKIPDNATVLLLIDPRYPFDEKEKKTLDTYLQKGGQILVLCGIETDKSWIAWLKSYGFVIGNNLVIDPATPVYGGGSEFLATNQYTPHPITDPFFSGRTPPPILLPVTRSVASTEKPNNGASIVPLIQTTQLGRSFPVTIEKNNVIQSSKTPEKTGTISVACAATLSSEGEEKGGRIVVVGSSAFANNRWLGNRGITNRDFALNAISWLAESKNTIALHPKPLENQPFLLDQRSATRLFVLSIVLLPGCGVFLGVANWLRRRNL